MKIVLCSPVSFDSGNQSGIQIRIKGIAQYLRDNDHSVRIIDTYDQSVIKKFDFVYCLVSTKKYSITHKVVQGLNSKDYKLIIDLYTPILLEKDLTYSPFNPLDYFKRRNQIAIVKKTLAVSTYFIVANKRQKDYWLATSKKLYQPIKSNFISTIPTGYPSSMNFKRRPQNIIAWFGGIYPWLDPAPLAKSFASLASRYPTWRLKIIGSYHPNTGYRNIFKQFTEELKNIPSNQIEIIPWQKSKVLAEHLTNVSFAVHLPKKTMEDFYSHRVRLLTLTNFGIPVATSGQDLISKIIINLRAGCRISPNVMELQNQISDLLKNSNQISKMSANTRQVQVSLFKHELSDKIFSR